MTDWSKGNGFPYEKASSNSQVVGAEVALFINYLIEEHGAKATDFHVIGHSLGGQTAGYVGERVVGLGRITGRYSLKRKHDDIFFFNRFGSCWSLF
jgi:pancreatic triacylglycerol lipase